MNINLISLLFFSSIYSEKLIRNYNIPSCKNCIFYKPVPNRDFSCILSECTKFGEKNILSNEIKYDLVKLCRLDESKCGIQGKYFKEEKNIDFKIWNHIITNLAISPPWIFTLSTIFLQIFFLFQNYKNDSNSSF